MQIEVFFEALCILTFISINEMADKIKVRLNKFAAGKVVLFV